MPILYHTGRNKCTSVALISLKGGGEVKVNFTVEKSAVVNCTLGLQK